MSKFELKLPRMGESVAEATLTSWLKEVGDTIEMDEAIFEIATDKVDSEVPSEVDGILLEKCYNVDDVVKVGQTVAIIQVGDDVDVSETSNTQNDVVEEEPVLEEMVSAAESAVVHAKAETSSVHVNGSSDRFYSPLVKNIAKEEGISFEVLDQIAGTGKDGRVTKDDILSYVKNGVYEPVAKEVASKTVQPVQKVESSEDASQEKVKEETSAHVQSFIEVDVTNIVKWRNKIKDGFFKREGEKFTFTPIFMEAVAKALKKYPMMNISVEGDTVVKKKNINIGMAAALPDGNLIVPVIKNADQLNLMGIAKVVNDLADRSRNNALKPDEVQGGTYTVTNVGTFGSVFGTPIINQPQVGIMALGAIRKIPSVIETSEGDVIAIRSKMYLSHSYDHRVVNGALGSMFAKAVADYLEGWDVNREV